MPLLGINVDHVATLREARQGREPDPVEAARICERAGADSIVCHLREDRRHIHDKDVRLLKRAVRTRLNLEMSLAPEIIRIAAAVRPSQVTLVPERRREVTTEGGLDVLRFARRIRAAAELLGAKGILVSVFIDPVARQIETARDLGVPVIELHTGRYALARSEGGRRRELAKLTGAAALGRRLGLVVNAGHGLDYHNTAPVAAIEGIEELNIGHSVIARAVFVGLETAVREMKRLAGGA